MSLSKLSRAESGAVGLVLVGPGRDEESGDLVVRRVVGRVQRSVAWKETSVESSQAG